METSQQSYPFFVYLANKDDEVLLKSIISLLNDSWRTHNQTAHGDRISHPQEIIKDSESIVAFSALTFLEKTNTSVGAQP